MKEFMSNLNNINKQMEKEFNLPSERHCKNCKFMVKSENDYLTRKGSGYIDRDGNEVEFNCWIKDGEDYANKCTEYEEYEGENK